MILTAGRVSNMWANQKYQGPESTPSSQRGRDEAFLLIWSLGNASSCRIGIDDPGGARSHLGVLQDGDKKCNYRVGLVVTGMVGQW